MNTLKRYTAARAKLMKELKELQHRRDHVILSKAARLREDARIREIISLLQS